MTIASVATFGLLAVMMFVPAPYAVQAAGPTLDTLSEQDDVDLISVDDARTYPTSGQLLLTTVTTMGGPGHPVYVGRVIAGWLSSSVRVVPVETVFDPEQTQEDIDRASAAQMVSSQEMAIVAALTQLGYEVPAVLTISGAHQDGGADAVAQDGDVITGIEVAGEQTEIATYDQLAQALAATPAGTTVTLHVLRAGEPTGLEIVTGDDGAGGSVLGVWLDAEFEYPVDVRIQIDNVGGPSAGVMFALGIVDLMTPGQMTGGATIAGTGTISIGGAVGPIGGVAQKLAGARTAGAEYFLVPGANCDGLDGNIPADIQVIAVNTLEEAVAAVEAIGVGQAQDLPGC
ncbi:MAG: PDZ domain-containing protein [Beutenbergiaceae bacterium]